ncbi:MAG: radical SAM protein [Acholeplasmataceae bacterium]|nr:radical SAM protein [Acholeplasmataceae bacterium]
MIKYYPKLLLTFSEIEDQPSLLIHGLTGCMFHCYQCFNYDELVKKDHLYTYGINDVIDTIKKQESLFENILISGGEFLLAPLESLIEDLRLIKKTTKKPVIVYTTGIELTKMKTLHEMHLIDGFHVDMKLPYHLLRKDDFDLIEKTIGIKINSLDLIERLIEAIEFVVQTDQGYSQIRSVKYPFLDPSAFHECKIYVQELNDKYNKNIPYYVNKFIYPETQEKEG